MLAWDQLKPVVLERIGDRPVVASELRDRLAAAGASLSVLAFLGMMVSLERSGYVVGRRTPIAGEDGLLDRRYELTAEGRALLASADSPRREAA